MSSAQTCTAVRLRARRNTDALDLNRVSSPDRMVAAVKETQGKGGA